MSEIHLQRSETGVATLTLDRQHRKNAVPSHGWAELARLFHESAHASTVRVLVVAGESARFSEIFVRRGLSLDFGGSWLLPRLDADAQSVNLVSEDVREGFAAFLQKRSPTFRGR